MADHERPNFIKPEEQLTLMGYPEPGNKVRRSKLEAQSERDKQAALEELIKAGRLRLVDVHDMLTDGIKIKEDNHQDLAGLKR